MEKPRQSSPSAPDAMTSPSVLLSRRAPTSLLTLPSLRGPTEMEVSSPRLLDVVVVKLRLTSLHRKPPSFEAAVRRRGCCPQLVLEQTGKRHLWLHSGVVPPRRGGPLCPAVDEAASRQQQAVSTCRYFLFAVTQSLEDPFSWLRPSLRFCFAANFEAGCRYTFNIYGCTENGHKLLEIQTGYTQELREC